MKEKDNKSEDLKKTTWKYASLVLYGGIGLVFLISLFSAGSGKIINVSQFMLGVGSFLTTFGCALLIGGASFSTGGFLGFIFGIPSLIQNENSGAGRTFFKYNDNLVQISDWLTKIIVGVGLTMLYRIPGKLEQLGQFLAPNFKRGEKVLAEENSWGEVAALAVVFYFLLFGFLIIYFWTRTDFTAIMKEVDDDLQSQLAAKEQELEAKEQKLGAVMVEKETLKKQKEDIKTSAQKMANELIHTIIPATKSKVLFNAKRQKLGDEPKQEAFETPKIPTEEFRKKIEEVYKSKEVISPNDLQKGRWGGESVVGGYILEANQNTDISSDVFQGITLTVKPINFGVAFNEQVAFFLHDTFPNEIEFTKAENDAAQLDIISYEAFVVGARTESGIELELDLNTVKGFPNNFYYTLQ